jgi:hypothetical protein
MLSSIQFNHQPRIQTHEVDNGAADQELALELESA